MRSALEAFLDQYSAESSATKICEKRASTRGLPDSRTTASANSLREAMIRSRSSRNIAHRWRTVRFIHVPWAARARETISGNSDAGVLSKCASTSPVAGLIEGIVSMGMAVGAIRAILPDFDAEMWMWNPRPRRLFSAGRADISFRAPAQYKAEPRIVSFLRRKYLTDVRAATPLRVALRP